MTPFSAVLLAGGQGRRMGRDKALLSLPDGRQLWERQLDVLRELSPTELFISGPRRAVFPTEVPCLSDVLPDRGPLAGIATALENMQTPLLVVLAVDLPHMTAAFLRDLLALTSPTQGVVPRLSDTSQGHYEPLAAVYPRGCLTLVRAQFQGDDFSLRKFARDALAASLLREHLFHESTDAALFTNWNTPADMR